MKINEYIESGILETYVLGSASEAEARELHYLKKQHPQIQDALLDLEMDLERIAQNSAINPPPGLWTRIEDNINELARTPEVELLTITEPPREHRDNSRSRKSSQFIEVEAESNFIRIHKAWRWIFGAVFLLGKIFLAFAIYFYLQNRQNEKEMDKIKTDFKIHNTP